MAGERRLIDANVLIEEINQQRRANRTSFPRKSYVVGDVLTSIYNAPTVDAVEVVHGRWEWLGPNRLVSECMCGTCSVCKVRSKYIVNTDICPNCGAKMDGGTDDGI